MQITLDSRRADHYPLFLKIKSMPQYDIQGHVASFPDEYASMLGVGTHPVTVADYKPWPGLFDYQRDITATAIQKQKYCVFADCGLGKTLIFLEFARHAAGVLPDNRKVLIISPLMVVQQTMAEAARWYGDALPLEQVRANNLQAWLHGDGGRIGITNYDAMTDDIEAGRLGGLILDESSMLKSHYGHWGQACIRLGRGLPWKMACTGTPAPNDRIEYANHAVFMDAYPTVNAFLARFFVNRGQTDNRWELKPHALEPFYRALSHWSIFLTNPATYGWKDNCESIPPIHVHVHDVPMTKQQRNMVHDMTGQLFVAKTGGIASRSKLGQISKGGYKGQSIDTKKPEFVRKLVESWPEESTIIWCLYNDEQDRIAAEFPGAANISGSTPLDERQELIDDFKAGRRRVLIRSQRFSDSGSTCKWRPARSGAGYRTLTSNSIRA